MRSPKHFFPWRECGKFQDFGIFNQKLLGMKSIKFGVKSIINIEL